MFAPTVWASPTGSIAGSVKDPSGAVISSAKLTLVNIATNAKVEAASDSNGAFQFLQLTPAVYSLNVEADGFKKLVMEGIVVEVDQITHVEATLQVGSVSQTVEVSGGAIPLLENDRSTLSNVVESEEEVFDVLRYIALNPVKAGICARPADYPWSSYQAVVGDVPAPSFLDVKWVLALFGDDPRQAAVRFAEFVAAGWPERPRPVPGT